MKLTRTMTRTCRVALLVGGLAMMTSTLAFAQDKPDHPTSAPKPDHPTPAAKPSPPVGPAGGLLRPPANVAPDAGAPQRVQVILADPPIIELGEFSTSETKAGNVMLKNNGDKPVTVVSAKASCGCTTADFKRNTVLQPGEETEVTVRMRGGPTARVLNKTVTFTIEGYPQLKVPVKGKSIAYVTMAPDRVGINDNPEGKIVFKSIDDTPFKILNVQPAIVKGELTKEAGVSQEVTLDWDAFLDTAKNSRVTFYFDHPKCSQHFTIVKLDAEQRGDIRKNAGNARPDAKNTKEQPLVGPGLTASGQATGVVTPRTQSLANLVRRGKTAEVKERLKGEANAAGTDDSGTPLLAIAGKEGNVEMMVVLLDAGVDIDQTDRVGKTK